MTWWASERKPRHRSERSPLLSLWIALSALILILWALDALANTSPDDDLQTVDEELLWEVMAVFGKPAPVMVWWDNKWWCVGGKKYPVEAPCAKGQ